MSLEIQANLLRGDELTRRRFVARAASSMLGVGLASQFMTGKAGAAPFEGAFKGHQAATEKNVI